MPQTDPQYNNSMHLNKQDIYAWDAKIMQNLKSKLSRQKQQTMASTTMMSTWQPATMNTMTHSNSSPCHKAMNMSSKTSSQKILGYFSPFCSPQPTSRMSIKQSKSPTEIMLERFEQT